MKKLFLLIVNFVLVATCVATLASIQRRGVESRELNGTFNEAYRSVISVFKDYGYDITYSNHKLGVIQAETGIKGKWRMGALANFEITITIEPVGDSSVRERITLVKKERIGSKNSDRMKLKVICDPNLFRGLHEDIQKEMLAKRNLNEFEYGL